MLDRTVEHDTLVIDRTFDAASFLSVARTSSAFIASPLPASSRSRPTLWQRSVAANTARTVVIEI